MVKSISFIDTDREAGLTMFYLEIDAITVFSIICCSMNISPFKRKIRTTSLMNSKLSSTLLAV
jgi:hypothetical protein